MSNEPLDGWGERIGEAIGVEWIPVAIAHEHNEDHTLLTIGVQIAERAAPGHVSPLRITIEATGRYPAAVEEQVIRAIRRLSRLEEA